MKKIFFATFVFIFCHIFTGCFFLWCEPGIEWHPLSGTAEILVSPQQEEYNCEDEITLTIKYSSTENSYNKILLKNYVEIYDPTKKKYISTDNMLIHKGNSEENLANNSYELLDCNNPPSQSLEEKLFIQTKNTGHYRIVFFVLGCKKDSDSADSYSKYFYIEFQ